MQDHTPAYLSTRSAEAILSEVRPTRIRAEALLSVNILLDEILWLVLNSAKSISTDKLKTGLLKVLTTPLGKSALLEAEVELRAYWERTPRKVTGTIPVSGPDFPLQTAFELLRHKCEVYCSLGDVDESPEIESRLKTRMLAVSPTLSSSYPLFAPAALYLTAILEHICEHTLSNVARVVARDSSRTTAHLQDLFVALCEDDLIYGLFRTMKVYDQIEQQTKAAKPRRSKSFTRSGNESPKSPSRANSSSPLPPSSFPQDKVFKAQELGDSGRSNQGGTNQHHHKSSMSGAIKMFRTNSSGRKSGEHERSGNPSQAIPHQRSDSVLSESTKRALLAFHESPPADDSGADEPSIQDFDDLMRSGSTMKVSLTPDRLKTFEVFAKEKNQRLNKSALGNTPMVAPLVENGVPASPAKIALRSRQPGSKHNRNAVDAIGEEGESDPSLPVRQRVHSIHHNEIEKPVPSTPRKRSVTDAADLSQGLLVRKTSLSKQHKLPSRLETNGSSTRGKARNRESLDLDELMDEGFEDSPPLRSPMTPKTPQATSTSTRDLIDFLSEGPPEVPEVPQHLRVPPVPPKTPGRFRTIVNRLTRVASSERLGIKQLESPPDSFSRNLMNSGTTRSLQSLASRKQRSITNITEPSFSSQNLVRSQAPLSHSQLPALPNGANSSYDNLSAPLAPVRKLSLTRKAVPAWNPSPTSPDAEKPQPLLQLPSSALSSSSKSRSPSPANRRPSTAPASPVASLFDVSNPPMATSSSSAAVQTENEILIKETGTVITSTEPVSRPPTNEVLELQHMLSRATNLAECQLLVDLFFTRWGFTPSDESSDKPPFSPLPIQDNDKSDDHHKHLSMVEMLLADGFTPSHETPQSQPPVPPKGLDEDIKTSHQPPPSPRLLVSAASE